MSEESEPIVILDPLDDASPEEAFFALLVCALAADGSAQKAERDEFAVLVKRSRTLAPFEPMHRDWLGKHLGALQGDGGFDADRVRALAEAAAPRIPPHQRLSVFAHVCDLAFSDSDFAAGEQWLIKSLAIAFELPFDTVRQIVQVLSWKNAH